MFLMLAALSSLAQNVGIGTSTPHAGSILDLGSSRPLLLPRLTTEQMLANTPATVGQIVYNSTEHTLYGFTRFRNVVLPGQVTSRWEPIGFGPRMLAYGVVDSFANVLNGSGNFSVQFNATENWYELNLVTPHEYFKDSMLLIITPVGNGSWDQNVATGEVITGSSRVATIKFVDVSRQIAGTFGSVGIRRRSWFHFVLYDLRTRPYP